MSQSYIKMQGRGFWTGDTALQIWLGILVEQMRAVVDSPDWFDEVRDEWWAVSFSTPTGCLDPHLDYYVHDRTRGTLVECCDKAIAFIEAQGESLDHVWLSEHGIAGEEYRYDVPIAPFVRVGHAFRALIAGEPGPFADSPQEAQRVDLPY